MSLQKIKLPALSQHTSFDKRLWEVPTDAVVFAHLIWEAEKRLQQANHDDNLAAIFYLHGYLGDACRVMGRLDEAVEHLEKAVELSCKTANKRAEIANRIRLAEARKYRGEYDAAERMLQEVATETKNGEAVDYHHFALQHWGKCLLDQGKRIEAITVLEKVLAVRESLGNEGWIQSTQMALELAKKGSGK